MKVKSVTSVPFRNEGCSSALVCVASSDGRLGWGETECPAPEAVCALVDHLLRYGLEDHEVEPTAAGVSAVWHRLAQDLRAANQSGGLAYDALAALDLALWDLAGQTRGLPVCRLLAPEPRPRIDALWCGDPRLADAAPYRHRKLYYSSTEHDLLLAFDQLRLGPGGESLEIAVDARWRLDWSTGPAFGARLDDRRALWLECPIPADNPAWHGMLARQIHTPVAIGQAYRSIAELEPFFQQGGLRVLQPDPGRMGLSEALRAAHIAASYCMTVAPRAGRSAGPRLAAALHLAAAAPECSLLPYHPQYGAAWAPKEGQWQVPDRPGLGIAPVV